MASEPTAMTVDEATIAALLDGSLEPAVSERVEAEVAGRKDLLQALGELALLNCTLRRAMSAPFAGRKAPAELVGPWLPQRRTWRRSLSAIAAGLVALVAAAAGFAGGRAGKEAELASAYLEVYAAHDETINRALESFVSGETVTWAKPGTDWTLEITPIRTYRSADEHWCREYRSAEEIGAMVEIRLGIACRASDGHWERRVEQMLES